MTQDVHEAIIIIMIITGQDLSLENIEDLFNKSWSKRANILYYLR